KACAKLTELFPSLPQCRYCRLELGLGTMPYQSTAAIVMASAKSVHRAATVNQVNRPITSDHTIHCTVLLLITNSCLISSFPGYRRKARSEPGAPVEWPRNPHRCEFRGPWSPVRHRGDR